VALLGLVWVGSGAAALSAQDTIPPAPPPAATEQVPATGALVDSIAVRGNHRLSDAAVRTLSGLQPGTRVSGVHIQAAIRRLMNSGNFDDVAVLAEGTPPAGLILVIDVAERPLIGAIDFRGLERISARTVRDTLKLTENQPLDPNQVARTEQMIRDLLAKQGVQLLSIDTTLTPMAKPEGAYRLTYEVREGQRLTIADVEFQGNQAFSDAALRDAMRTKPEGFFWFRSGRFDPEVFREDLRARLPDFYASHGYIDFAVLGDTMRVDPQTGKTQLVVRVEEGPQYRLGDFVVEGNTRFPSDQLTRIFTTQRRSVLGLPFGISGTREAGEVFDRGALRSASQRVEQMYKNEGYLYAQVEPVLERVPATDSTPATVNVTWAVSERSPFYIDQIRIEGNTFTHESVIRNRIFVLPGDIYSEDRLIQSYQSISQLGFFETPIPTPDINPNPETGEVEIVFHVKEKQTGTINFGTAIGGGYRGGGVSGFLGYSQPNLFGQAKQADLRAEYGYGRNSFQASYTDPALLGSRNSGSASLFHYSDRYSPFNDGRRIQTGGSLRFGMPVPALRWSTAFLGYSLARNRYEARDADCSDPTSSLFCLPSATASTVTLGLTRDTRDGQLFPTLGTRQALSVGQTGGLLGGDGNFEKVTGEFEWWVPVGRIGGSAPGSRPIRTTVGMRLRTGTIFGNAGPFPLERFYLGGTQFGEQVRGYEESEITPLGYIPRDNTGFPSLLRGGNAFLTVTGEYAIRLNDNLSFSIFGDAGNVWTNATQIDPTRLFRGAGLGVTIVTPFGPLGLDYAYGFDRINPGWQFHFKLGSGF
jgi:outer membrane protein insertion porin family